MRMRTLYAFVAITSRQSPRRSRLPSHSAGNKTNLEKSIKDKVKNGFRRREFFLPSFAKSHAIQDCVTHSAGVIWRVRVLWKPASLNKRWRVSSEKWEM